MQPRTVDANRPKGRFCILGSEMVHVWSSACVALEERQFRCALRNVLLQARPIVKWRSRSSERSVQIGPLWTDQAKGDSVPNRTTVDRFTVTLLRAPFATRQHWYPSIPMLFPHSMHLESSVGALGLSAVRREPPRKRNP